MSKVIVTESKLTAIANAIRSKLGVQTEYALDDMPNAIASISGGGTLPDEQLVSHYDFTSNTPFYDIVRDRTATGDEKYGTLTTTEGVGLTLSAASCGIRTQYGLNWGEQFKIEFELGACTYVLTEEVILMKVVVLYGI